MPPQSPAPTQTPSVSEGDQYDFIVNPEKKPGKNIFAGSLRKRIIIVVSAAVLFLVIGLILFSVLSRGSASEVDRLVKIAQQQNELIRVAGIGTKKARGTPASNLALTTQLSLQSSQPALINIIKTAGHKLTSKELDLGKNPQTDLLLTQADQNNNFDAVFIQTVQDQLLAYQKSLKAAYDGAGPKTKAALAEQYKAASLLVTTKPSP